MTSNTTTSSRVMTFSPSQEEFRDFGRYVAYMESQGAHRAGLARVIPPKGWRARRSYDDLDDLVISAPIQQVVTGQSGLFTQYNIQKKPMTLHEFRKMSGLDKFRSPRYLDLEELERKFWKNLTFNPPLYGADVSGTLYDPDVMEWNVGHLNSILEVVATESVDSSITAPFLDFGMWKSAFAWHTEDMDLYSLSYLHFGQPRSWYAVPPEHGKRLERLAKGFFPGNAQSCEAFLRHKMTLISPSILKKYGIPFEKVTQEAGQFIVSFPFCYRAGFNHGFNGTESVNFAMQRWVDYGKQAVLCSCRQDVVKISMDVFVRRFQPDRYKLWKAGKDVAVVDHTKPSPEASEFFPQDVVTVDHAKPLPEPTEILKMDVVTVDNTKPLSEAGEFFNKDVVTISHTKPSSEPAEFLNKNVAVIEHAKPLPEPAESLKMHVVSVDNTKPSSEPTEFFNKDVAVVEHTKPSLEPTESLKMDVVAVDNTKPKAEASQILSKDKVGRLKKVNRLGEANTITDQDFVCQDIKPDANLAINTEREVPESVSIYHDITLDVKEDVKEIECNKKKLSLKESLTKVTSRPETGKSVSKKNKDMKPQSKPPQTRTSTKKTSTRRSPSKKDRNGVQASDPSPPEEVKSIDDPTTHRVFQRTLSPLDVLHVHSYAKGDYGDGDTAMEEEESAGGVGLVQQGVQESVADLGKKEDLGHLPGGHPLMKEEDPSEQEALEHAPSPTLQQDGLHGELWAKPLTDLWQNRPANLKKEREFNQRCASKPPYCSICSLFSAHHQTQCATPPVVVSRWMRTKPLIPESCFTTTTEEDSRQRPVTRDLEEDGTSMLVSCSQCSVRVHASCYGVDPSSVSLEWKCARCTANAMTENCCLCALRGGALHRANNNKWVHVLCAVAVLEARFVNVSERSPVDLSGIPLQRFKLKCYYCKKRAKKASGCCVQCSHGRCPTAYHPTCAQAAGVLMQPDDWPFVVHVTCCRHKGPAPIERDKAAMLDLAVGQKVICKHKNGRYYQCDVVQLSNETFYEVNFDDGSFSDNLFPEDIVSRDCTQLGPPLQGDVVQVRWTDGLVYGAKFVSTHVIQMYLVEFEDGSQLTAKRDDVYTLDEQLPKRVKSRLSKASDMRFDGIFEETEILQESKRQRVINSRYRGDYIEPVIYRAIME